MKNTLLLLGGIILVAAGVYFGFVNKGPSRDTLVFAGNYQAYETNKNAINSDKITVLDFDASRCPSCRAAHNNFLSEVDQIPDTLQILNVDYDTNQDLRAKYGVTSQHTFVLIDKEGSMIKKVQGLNHVSEIIAFVGDYKPVMTVDEVTIESGDVITGDMMMSGEDNNSVIENTTAPKDDANTTITPQTEAQQPQPVAKPSAGIYTDYESGKKYISDSSKKVVLFFHASRCPNCKQAEKDIIANKETIDSNLVILKVDYDNSTELKQQYGVTSQTTYILVNADGSLNKKAQGMTSLAAIEQFVQ